MRMMHVLFFIFICINGSDLLGSENGDAKSIADQFGMNEAQVQGMMAAMKKGLSKGAEDQKRALADGTLNQRDVEMYDYMQARWKFYESRDGFYSQETHDEMVLQDAARRYGISVNEADQRYMKVAMIKSGAKY